MSSDERLERRVAQLIDSSQVVLDDCAIETDELCTLVAGNSANLLLYPPNAESYLFFWGRDASFQLESQYVLDPGKAVDRAIKLARWLRRIPHFDEDKILVKRYAPNGALDVRYGEHFQPDQGGALMGTLDKLVPEKQDDIDYAVFTMAEGLAENWDGRGFGPTQELWENRETSHEHHDVFTYTLASVIHGMRQAITRARRLDGFDHYAVDHWEKSVREMVEVLESVETDVFLRKIYPDPWHHDADNTLDASLNGLVYPFDVIEKDRSEKYIRLERTVLAVDNELRDKKYGVKRYLGDTYDGIWRKHAAESKAGSWPLLTFWHAIAMHKLGKVDEAKEVFYGEIDQLDKLYTSGALPDNMIPEQIYSEDLDRQGKSIMPLAWSHAMLVLAAHALDIVKK